MSFISNLLNSASGVSSFFANTAGNIANVGKSIESLASNVANFISQIPSELLSAITSVGQGIVYGLGIIGSFFSTAFHDLSSAIYAGLQRIESAFQYVGKALYNVGIYMAEKLVEGVQWFRKGLLDLGNLVWNALVTLAQALAPVLNDIVEVGYSLYNALASFGADIVNFFSSLASDFTPVSNFFNSIYQQLADLPNLPINIAKQEATRLGTAFPRVVGYNVALETLKNFSRATAFSSGIKGMLAKGLLGPFVSMLAGILTETALQSFYPDVSSTGVATHNISKSVPNATTPLNTSVSLTPQQPQSVSISGSLSSVPEPVPPTPGQLKGGTVIAVTVSDAMNMLTQITKSYYGGVVLSNLQQSLTDNLNISAVIVPKLLGLYQLMVQDSTSPISFAESALSSQTVNDEVQIDTVINAFGITLPQGFYICATIPPEQTSVSGTSYTDVLNVDYESCYPLAGGAFDQVNAYVYSYFVPSENTQQDTVSISASPGLIITSNTFTLNLPFTLSFS
ncbi:MAG: hypothetical protein QXJ24_05615 [Thermoplasmatales archaeon]